MFHRLINRRRLPLFAGHAASGTTEEGASHPGRGAHRPTRRRLFVGAAGLALLLLTLLPAMAVGAQSVYPPNTVISTYFDPRYGEVSVVTDASGNLIDVNALTGQRIFPVYADYTSAYANGYVAPAYTSTYVAPTYVNANYFSAAGTTAYLAGTDILRQYSDPNSNCADGQVTQTVSGYYCTTTGTPAFHVG